MTALLVGLFITIAMAAGVFGAVAVVVWGLDKAIHMLALISRWDE